MLARIGRSRCSTWDKTWDTFLHVAFGVDAMGGFARLAAWWRVSADTEWALGPGMANVMRDFDLSLANLRAGKHQPIPVHIEAVPVCRGRHGRRSSWAVVST